MDLSRARRTRLLALGVMSMLIGLPACKPEVETPPKSAAGASDSFTALTAEPGHVLSADGRIRAPEPASQGWECLEEQHGAEASAAVALRCRREDPHEFLFLAAKTSRQPIDQRTDAHTLLMSLYRADNEGFFDHVEYLHDGPAELVGSQGWEAELEAEHARLGTVRKRERIAIIGDRVFAISAEGKPELWTRYQTDIDRWFANVEFAR